MIDLEKYKESLKKIDKKNIIIDLMLFAKTENMLEKMFPEAYDCYAKAAEIVAKDESIGYLKQVGATEEQIIEYMRHIKIYRGEA